MGEPKWLGSRIGQEGVEGENGDHCTLSTIKI